jgi:hypothetical protein
MSWVVPIRCRAVPSVCHFRNERQARTKRDGGLRSVGKDHRWDRLGGRKSVERYLYGETEIRCEPLFNVREPRPTKVGPTASASPALCRRFPGLAKGGRYLRSRKLTFLLRVR